MYADSYYEEMEEEIIINDRWFNVKEEEQDEEIYF